MNDIFCRIIAGEIPSAKVYEDEQALAILDLSQLNKGHTLVMPKAHYETMLDCPKELLGHLFDIAKRIGIAQQKVLGAAGVNILVNCYKEAGQEVPHFHIHVIPRYVGVEGGFHLANEAQDTSKLDFAKLAETLSQAL